MQPGIQQHNNIPAFALPTLTSDENGCCVNMVLNTFIPNKNPPFTLFCLFSLGQAFLKKKKAKSYVLYILWSVLLAYWLFVLQMV